MRRLVYLLISLVPSLGLAQQYRLEITPTAAYRWGGGVVVNDSAFKHRDFNVDVSSGGAYGVKVGLALNEVMHVELMVDRQPTSFVDKQGLFGEIPGGFVKPGDRGILDVTITYYHAGVAWDFGTGPNRGFVVGSAGITHINPLLPLPNDKRLSLSVGGGYKMDFSERIGMRFEARYFWTDTDTSTGAVYHFGARDCTGSCSYIYSYKNSLSQTELSAGLTVRF